MNKVKCFHCKIIKAWKNRKTKFIPRRPIKCTKCGIFDWYAPPGWTTKFDNTIVCHRCIPKPISGYFEIYGNLK